MATEKFDKSARVFFALWPHGTERAALATWQPVLQGLCGGRTVRTEILHATLLFLGNVPLRRLEALQLAAHEVNGESFGLAFDVAHYWGHNHVVYASPHIVPQELMQLVQALEERLTAHRFNFDKRPFKPHVTLLRHARWDNTPLPQMQKVVWRVRNFALVQSVPDEKGANYQVLVRMPLNPA